MPRGVINLLNSVNYAPLFAMELDELLLNNKIIDLFHNSGLLIYSFICMIISLSDLVSMCNSYTKEFLLSNEVRKVNGPF